MNDNIEVEKWPTLLSECSELYYVKLIHQSDLRLVVKDAEDHEFEVVVADPGPYRVVDEQYLVDYWNSKGDHTGWTFRVIHGGWPNIPVELLEVYLPERTHYVVATLDYCLEVLGAKEPVVKQL